MRQKQGSSKEKIVMVSKQGPSVDPPTILGCIPSFKIDSYEAAVAHYVEWLGFNLDWEWRSEAKKPVIMSISRDNLSLFLNEAGEQAPTVLRVQVSNLAGLVGEWNQKVPGSVEVILEQPYEIPTAYVRDPFGNMMAIQEAQTAETATEKSMNADRVREYLNNVLRAGATRPTPQQIVDEVGGTLGVASETLGDYQEWKL
jgi:hypothetical protein